MILALVLSDCINDTQVYVSISGNAKKAETMLSGAVMQSKYERMNLLREYCQCSF